MKRLMQGIILVLWLILTVNLWAANDIEIEILNRSDNQPAGSLQFPIPAPVDGAIPVPVDDPWLFSDQYLRLIYDCDVPIWGIRIFTNNNGVIGGLAPYITGIGPGPDNVPGTADDTWQAGADGIFGTGDDIWGYGPDGVPGTDDDTLSVSYSGLINPATKDDPSARAALVWQVFNNPVPDPTQIFQNWQGNWNVGGAWNDDWAYLIDLSDRWQGNPSIVDAVFYTGTWNARFEMVVTGNPIVNYLAQHPVVSGPQNNPDPKPGDCDIAIYIAACFGKNQNPEEPGSLGAGNYGSTIYLQLISE